MELKAEALRRIESILWDSNSPDRHKLEEIEGLLYELNQMQDAHSMEIDHE